ncbi:hypothetical protein [Lysobacter capsici]|uniref:hypothetical protein n=1 Tax=Lysobacter capsici TaxID=435897 RepID=UPI001C9E0320|nr:hypothetical protein [Lysobacter capsici]
MNLESHVGEINIPREERDALKAIQSSSLSKLVEQCLDEKRSSPLRILRLESCGPYVASQLRKYGTALAEYGAAKSTKKLAEAEARARRAGNDLTNAIEQMKHRVEVEEKEMQLFQIDDQIMPPYRFSEHLTVRVNYRWRPTIEDEWVFGSITFSHDVDPRPDYTLPKPKRKPSAGKQEQDRQDKLWNEWQHLMRLGLHSVKDYFREGRNAAAIPLTFLAKTDPYTRTLNNFSAQFWNVDS